MASTYSPNLRIELIGNGEQSNTWGTTTNTNLGTLIEQAISGLVSVDVTAGNVTLTSLNGASDQSRQMIIVATGTPGVTRTITAPAVNKVYIVYNNSNATLSFIASGGTGVSLSAGAKKLVYCDGTNFVEAIDSVAITSGSINGTTIGATTASTGAFTTLSASSTVSGTGFSTYLASPPAIGGTTAAAGKFTTLEYTGTLTGSTGILNIGSGQLYKDASGNVGIGTSSPSAPLDIKVGTGNFTVGLQGAANAQLTASGTLRFNTTAGTTVFSQNTIESVRIDASGNVGIGVTPSTILHVKSATPIFRLETTGTVTTGGAAYNTIADSTSSTVWVNGFAGLANCYQFATNFTNGFMRFMTGVQVEAMRIDSSGNVGIGTSSPSYRLEVKGASATAGQLSIHDGTGDTTVSGVTAGSLLFQARDSSIRTIAEIDAVNTTTNGTGGAMVFQTRIADALAERMRIDSSGNLLVGTTTPPTTGHGTIGVKGAGTYYSFGSQNNGSTSFVVFNAAGTGVYLANGGTSWTGISDERLKTDLIPIENGLDKVNSLRSVTGRYKTDEVGTSRSFLIAQDVQVVLPEAVSVQDDELGTLGVAYTEVIPLLVASIKELKAIIDTQQEQINSLLGK